MSLNNSSIDLKKIESWLNHSADVSSIKLELEKENHSEIVIEQYIKEFKKQLIVKRQRIGFILTSVGAVLGFISCVLSITNPVPELYELILYGLTSVAILVIFLV